VEADVGAARRALLHRRVAQALEDAPASAPAELLAYHYARGGASEKAGKYLELAGDQAWAQRAHGAAQSHYREVLERLEALGRTQDAVRVREKLGEVLYRAGRYEAAIEVLEPAAEALRAAGDWEGLGRVTVRLGWPHAMGGTPREGIARLTALLELLEQSGASASTQATLYEALGELLFVAGEYGASLATGERAAALARAAGDDRTRVWAEWSRVNALQMLGRLRDALRLGHEVLPLAEAVGDQDNLLRAHRDLAYIHALRGAVETGRRSIERALALSEQIGDSAEISFTLALRGWLAVVRGDWPSACIDLDRAVALSRQVDQSWISAYSLLFRARLSLADGDRAAATAAGQEAIDLAERSGDLQALRWASGVMAEIDVLEGRPEAAGARLGTLLDRDGLQECDVTTLLPVLAWAQLEQGQVKQATATLGQALARARREEMRLVLVEALRVQALIARRQEHWAAAECSLEEGVALARSMPYPYAEARLLHVYGRLHIQKGEPEAARERLASARVLFLRLGARTDVARAQQALSTLPDALPSDAALHATAALSPRHGVAAASPAGTRLPRPDRHAWALDRLRAGGALSPRAYARALGVSVDTALLDLRVLMDRGMVRAQGTTRDRRYVLADDDRA
jgi:tetratricopeptide (TPR) repeat protein